MNAVNQYMDVSKKWFDAQVKTGQNWVEAMQRLDGFKPGLIFDKTVDAYQASVQETLNAEVAGARIWFEEVVPVKNLPEPAVDMVKQMQDMTEKVTDMQQSFVDSYFSFLKQLDVKELPLAIAGGEEPKPAPKAAKKA